jgi:hypothetical protein
VSIDCGEAEFLNFGESHEGMISFACETFSANKGLGVELFEEKVAQVRNLGFDCVQGDITILQFSENCVRFVTLNHILEHLSNLDAVYKAIANAVFYARDFLFIQGYCFDSDEMLAEHGFKLLRSGHHPLHLTLHQLYTVFKSLGLASKAQFFLRKRIFNSLHPAVHPLESPANQHEWRKDAHPEKPFVLFEQPVWSEFSCFVSLRENLNSSNVVGRIQYEREWRPKGRRQIIVLGMHRSGTSCVSGLLEKCGAYFAPKELDLGRSAENPKGFWERKDLRRVCDQTLYAGGADWDRPHGFSTANLSPEAADTAQKEFLQIFKELDRQDAWFIKEPRLCLLMPLLQALLDEPVYVLVYRNPVEVAESLRKRNNIPLPVGVALWERYMTEALNHTRDKPRVLVNFEDLTANPKEVTTVLLGKLQALDVNILHMPQKDIVEGFVDVKLRHHLAKRDRWKELLTPYQQELAETLADGSALDRETTIHLSESAAAILRLFQGGDKAIQDELTELRSQRASLQIAYERQKEQTKKLAERLQEAQVVYKEVINSKKWRIAQSIGTVYRRIVPVPIADGLLLGTVAICRKLLKAIGR